MNKLKNKVDDIINNWDCLAVLPNQQVNCILPELYGCISEDIAEEVKKIAIEFAKKLMETKITMLRSMSDEPEIRNSPAYALMKGELIINGDKLFEQFIEEYYV